eukprot:s1504_g7.t1
MKIELPVQKNVSVKQLCHWLQARQQHQQMWQHLLRPQDLRDLMMLHQLMSPQIGKDLLAQHDLQMIEHGVSLKVVLHDVSLKVVLHDVNLKFQDVVNFSMTSTCAIGCPIGRFIEDNTMLRFPSLPPAATVTVPASVMSAVRAVSEPHRERSPRRSAMRTARPPEVAPTPERHGADRDVPERDAGDGRHAERSAPDAAAQRFRKLSAPRQVIAGSGFNEPIARQVTAAASSASASS